jgi:hypothetical protein
MAIASIEFGVPETTPTPPDTGKKLFLGADGRFFQVLPNGTVEPLRATPSTHTHDISEVNGLQEAMASTVYSEVPPSNPNESDRWVDSTTFRAYEFFAGAWIEIVSS